MNHELSYFQAEFRKGRRTRDQIANFCWIIKKAREFQKNIYFCFIDYAKAFDCLDHNKLRKLFKEMRIPDHLRNLPPEWYLLRNLYTGQEATVRTGHGTTDWFQFGKGIHQGYILSPCLFNLYAKYICEMSGWIFTISYWQLKKTWEMIMLVLIFMLVVECLCVCLVVSDSATMDCSPSSSSVHGILQAKILELVVVSLFRGSFWPRDGTHTFCDPCIGRQILYHWTTWEACYWWEHFVNYIWSLIN